MGRITGSWLSGPQAGAGNQPDVEYRGEDLGLPESGPGALAGGWQRVLALMVDWLLSGGIALLFVDFGSPIIGTTVLGVWFVIGVVSITFFGFTPGQFAVGLRVARVDHGPERGAAEARGEVPPAAVGIIRALARQVLIVFLVPALINDYNGRAMHDRATGTGLVRTR
ncbi:RDD family protein [Gordonia soli]|uniref:RDD domain-containing protein n=1 Tax=Gordonia soli NBRC 108243 TaxID=1223545 RepID=M0QLF1_9ACTN|nr:RDD family protein [Gordonia soli]GAC69485.1 hypothetical protein GS4_25_00560 [Gordonia soli NBRC 108243]